jgi:hypothetical protein
MTLDSGSRPSGGPGKTESARVDLTNAVVP